MGRWEEDIKLMRGGIILLFQNQFEESEAAFRKGMDKEPPKPSEDVHDIRGSFALLYSLVLVMKGVATFAEDQLSECTGRLKEADSLASSAKGNWPGKKVTRGVIGLLLGLLQILQRSFLKGGITILKSWGYIRTLKSESLEYQGKEREVVRSAALFTLASFYILIGMLPSFLMKTATFFTGFDSDRSEGVRFLKLCWEEDGILAPWAALTLVAYHVDTKTFLNEKLTDEELKLTKSVIDWSEEKFPSSVFFSGLVSDFVAVSTRDTVRALEIQNEKAVVMRPIPALNWILQYKRGSYSLTQFNWFYAGKVFCESLNVYIVAKRRSMVPYTAAHALLCFAQCVVEDINVQESVKLFKDMLDTLIKYKGLKKSDWNRQDQWAFGLIDNYDDLVHRNGNVSISKASTAWPLLDLALLMTHKVRCTWWMSKENLQMLLEKLRTESAQRKNSSLDTMQYYTALVEINRQLDDLDECMKIDTAARELNPSLTKKEAKVGCINVIDCTTACLAFEKKSVNIARMLKKDVEKRGSDYDYYHDMLWVKLAVLSRNLGENIKTDFKKLYVPAGEVVTKTIEITDDFHHESIKWFWCVDSHSISFAAIFFPKGGDDESPELLQNLSNKEAAKEPLVGEISFEKYGPGKLMLSWDNSFSLFRSKTVRLSVYPDEMLDGQCD